MDTFEIVRALRRVSDLKHSIAPPTLMLNRAIADGQILIDPGCTSPYPSSSSNTVKFFGTERPVVTADAEALIDVYRSRGIRRFFVFMSPSSWLYQNLEALAAAGLTPFRGPDYHTLLRNMSDPIVEVTQCMLTVARLGPGSRYHSPLLEPGAAMAACRPEFDVWVAIDDDVVVGYGMSATVDSVTYLGGAATVETYRNRGIQTALIRARLQDAARRGSEIAVSETLSMLGSSLRNLQRAGFKITYDKVVYQYNAE